MKLNVKLSVGAGSLHTGFIAEATLVKPPPRRRKATEPMDYILDPHIEKIARKGFFEGELTSREIQEMSGAVLSAIASDQVRQKQQD